ncbi:MAG: ASCH domain-containing protein [Yoonia sp.]|uniref:ASCH domain-containing protein n=1 Tax=Yoonia sp. TaxID=2212373 RepID=UPI003EFAC5F2
MAEIEDLQETYPGAGTFQFGDSAETSADAINRVRRNNKRAISAPLSEFKDDPESMPMVGRVDIVADWDGNPTFVVKTVRVDEVRFCDITENMAKAEGYENLLVWRKATKAAISRHGNWDPAMPLVFEFFSLVEDLDGRQIEPDS